jgi:hypothetical protein
MYLPQGSDASMRSSKTYASASLTSSQPFSELRFSLPPSAGRNTPRLPPRRHPSARYGYQVLSPHPRASPLCAQAHRTPAGTLHATSLHLHQGSGTTPPEHPVRDGRASPIVQAPKPGQGRSSRNQADQARATAHPLIPLTFSLCGSVSLWFVLSFPGRIIPPLLLVPWCLGGNFT